MADKKIAILYVDDEENNLFSFKAVFRVKYQVFTAISGDEALKIMGEKPIEIIITDQRMPNMTGVEFLEKVICYATFCQKACFLFKLSSMSTSYLRTMSIVMNIFVFMHKVNDFV